MAMVWEQQPEVPAGSHRGSSAEIPDTSKAKLLQSRNGFSLLNMFQDKDPTNPQSSRCKTWIGNKGLLGVTTTHSLRPFAGVGKQKRASGDPCLGMNKLAPSPRVHGMGEMGTEIP